MSNQQSDDSHHYGSFGTPVQSISFAQSASPAGSNGIFYFGGSPAEPPHTAGPVPREQLESDPHRVKRIFRPNPLLQRPEDARERRRNFLLRKLQAQRENRAMQARGGEDEMLRLIYLSEKNRWESGQERVANAMSSWKSPADEEEFCTMGPPSMGLQASYLDPETNMAEVMAEMEEQELREVISSYEHPDSTQQTQFSRVCTGCGSDEILESSTEAICFSCGMSIDG